MGLKKRLGGVSTRRQKAAKPAFVGLIGPDRAALAECVIDFERLVLPNAERGPSGRPVHGHDSHPPVARRQLLRLADRVAAARSGASSQPYRVDAPELPPDAGAA
jgi:hypothetical protein